MGGPPIGNRTSVGRHIGQTFQLLVQHLGDHADLFVLELPQQSRRPVIGHECLAWLIGVQEHNVSRTPGQLRGALATANMAIRHPAPKGIGAAPGCGDG